MKMYNYLETYHIKDIKDYCQNRCIKIISEQLDNLTIINHVRGYYKGYLYGIKVCNLLIKYKFKIKRYELYNHVKNQIHKLTYTYNNKKDYIEGIRKALFDLLNYISI